MPDRPDTQQSFRERLAKNLAEQREILALMQANDALAWGLTPRPDHGSDLVPPRAVWLTEDDFFDVLAGGQQMQAVRQKITDAWDAAPADPVKTVLKALEARGDHYEPYALEILAALGMPDA